MKLQLTESQVQSLIKRLDEQEKPTSGTTTTQSPVSGQTTSDTQGQDDIEKLAPSLAGFVKFVQNPLVGIANALDKNYSGSTDNGGNPLFASNIPPGLELMHPLGPGHKVTSGFGYRNIGGSATKNHKGVDISAQVGTPVYAPSDGVVLAATDTTPNGCGGFVKINHIGANVQTKFCHLSKWVVSKGDQVKKGQLIAYSGGQKGAQYAGNSMGPHLHYEVLDSGGLAMNPTKVHPDMA